MLRLDQDFFRTFIKKMRQAQKIEIRIVKQKYIEKAKQMVEQEFKRLQLLVQTEFLNFADREEQQRLYSCKQQAEIERLTRLLTKSELVKQEIESYIATLNKNLIKESHKIQMISQNKPPPMQSPSLKSQDSLVIKS